MQPTNFMRSLQCIGDRDDERNNLSDTQLFIDDRRVERLATQILHCHKWKLVFRESTLIDFTNDWMSQLIDRSEDFDEPSPMILILNRSGRPELQGDRIS